MPTQKEVQLQSLHSLIDLIVDAAAKGEPENVIWNWGRAHGYATCLRNCGVISGEEAEELQARASAAKGEQPPAFNPVGGGTTFSFRAECNGDVDRFILAARAQAYSIHSTVHPDANGLPDVDVEIRTDASLDQLREVLRSTEDARVMLQTLRQVPLAENNLQRDFDLR